MVDAKQVEVHHEKEINYDCISHSSYGTLRVWCVRRHGAYTVYYTHTVYYAHPYRYAHTVINGFPFAIAKWRARY
jgi:hypothetical protein